MQVKRRKLLSLIGASPAILVGSEAVGNELKKTTLPVNHEPTIEVLNPKGNPPAINLIPMAQRISSLKGKTIYLVSDGFAGADRFLNQIKIWFAQNMPDVTTEYRLKAGGLADDDPKLWAEIKARGSAMIMAIGHCSTCTPATVGHCMTLEKMGIPTAPIVTIAFRELAQKNAADRGMPYERICYTPHPLTTRSDEQMWEVLQGKDPVTGKPLMIEVVGALTNPLTVEESKTGTMTPPRGNEFYRDTADNLQEHFLNNGMTDFLPIVLPTRKRVDAMLKGTSRRPDEIVGKLTPAPGAFPEWLFTVEQVATNAVMAGAKPEYFPLILAVASTGVTSLFSSTSSFVRMMVVNGPIRDKINMNCGIGAMGPFNNANATIGRAWTILSKNLCGGGMPGQTYMGTQGSGFNYNNLCFGETEDKMPKGWSPLHVQKGFKPEDNVVSLFSGWSLSNICWFSSMPIHEVVQGWLTHFFSTGNGAATLLLDPTVAQDVSNHGYGSKEEFTEWLMKNTKTPAWLYWQTRQKELKDAEAGLEPYASYLKLGSDCDIPISRFAHRSRAGTAAGAPMSGIEILVLGGQTNTYWMGGDFSYLTSASIDKWM